MHAGHRPRGKSSRLLRPHFGIAVTLGGHVAKSKANGRHQDVEAENRGAFSSVEAAFQSVFELLSYTSTIVFSRPRQFKWPSLISVLAVASANLAYTVFVRKRRGHLIHTEKLCQGRGERRRRQREEGLERIVSYNEF